MGRVMSNVLMENLHDVQQMTEAAVAKERAKLYAELKQSVSDHLMAANADELTSLKDK